MRGWLLLLGGLIVWTVHFFSLYAIASIFLTSTLARVLTLVVTAGCLAGDGYVLRRALRGARGGGVDEFTRWLHLLAALVAAISLVAVVWQGMPALLA